MNFLKLIFGRKWVVNNNPHGVIVPKSDGKIYVIPDIHGCFKTFKALLKKINLQSTDQLFLLGDYIDRGVSSCEVVDYIIDLQKDNNIYPLKGNHEEELLLMEEYSSINMVSQYLEKENTHGLYTEKLTLKEKYFTFFNSLPYFVENENFIFVHAGFDLESVDAFRDTSSMLEIRNWKYNDKLLHGKTVIHGHNVTDLDKIIKSVENKNKIISLDNGCVFKNIAGYGNLLCLCVNTRELLVQKNID